MTRQGIDLSIPTVIVAGFVLILSAAAGVWWRDRQVPVSGVADFEERLRVPMLAGARVNYDGISAADAQAVSGTATLLWVLRPIDCSSCNATEIGYWRRLVHECADRRPLRVAAVLVGDSTGFARDYLTRLTFPGPLLDAADVSSLGLPPDTPTPSWILVDSDQTVLFASAVTSKRMPPPYAVMRMRCGSNESSSGE